MGRVRAIMTKEFRQILRDRRSLGVLLFLPLFLLVMFGYAISLDVRHVPLAVYDAEKSPQSRRLVEEFRHSEYFDLKYDLASTAEIDELLGRERARAVAGDPERLLPQAVPRRSLPDPGHPRRLQRLQRLHCPGLHPGGGQGVRLEHHDPRAAAGGRHPLPAAGGFPPAGLVQPGARAAPCTWCPA